VRTQVLSSTSGVPASAKMAAVLPVRLRALVVWVSRLLAVSGVLAGISCATGDGMAARAPQLSEARAEELWFAVPGRCGPMKSSRDGSRLIWTSSRRARRAIWSRAFVQERDGWLGRVSVTAGQRTRHPECGIVRPSRVCLD